MLFVSALEDSGESLLTLLRNLLSVLVQTQALRTARFVAVSACVYESPNDHKYFSVYLYTPFNTDDVIILTRYNLCIARLI
jgi:hypothetical protein